MKAPAGEILAGLVHRGLAGLGFLLAGPLMLLLAAAIKATSRGPAFYRGARVGREGRLFTIYKFRTLAPGAEAGIGARLLDDGARRRYLTPIGRVLKRAKLDELPQLLNVLRGEMRLVGPRPIRPVFLDALCRGIPRYVGRFAVPPGITGIAQLRGGYYTSPRNKLRYDLIYIRNRSLNLDVGLIVLTFVKILGRWFGVAALGTALLAVLALAAAGRPGLGSPITLFAAAIVSVAILVAARHGLSEFALYRCPLNGSIVLFFAASVVSWSVSRGARPPFGRAAALVLAGALLSFILLNVVASGAHLTLAMRAIAATAVAVSAVSLLAVFAANYAAALGGMAPVEARRLLEAWTGGLADPVALALFLMLGLPLLLAEVAAAPTRRARDGWVVATTVAGVGIVFTQTVVGLVGVVVAVAVFLSRRLPHPAWAAALAVGLMFVSDGPMSTPGTSMTARARGQALAVDGMSVDTWLLGTPTRGGPAADDYPSASPRETPPREPAAPLGAVGGHRALIREAGILRWLVIVWLVVAVLRTLKTGYDRARDPSLRVMLRAAFAALGGFLVAMAGINALEHVAAQVLFWSLIGAGLGLAVHISGRRRHNLIWRFGDAGD